MIGTANSGCSMVCGGETVAIIDNFDWKNQIAQFSKELLEIPIALAADSGWVSPTTFTDTGNQWTSEEFSYDTDYGTYATNEYGGTGWGEFIELNLDSTTLSDRLRINTDYLDSEITEVDIDIYRDGAWVDVFQGGDEATWNVQTVEITYPKGNVDSVRFRYNYHTGGFYYWLYELEVYKTTPDITTPICGLVNTSYVGESNATIIGNIADDGGDPVSYRFQYGTTTAYSDSTSWTGSETSGSSFQEVLLALNGNSQYHYRMQLQNSAGITDCDDQTFVTATAGASWITPSGSSGAEWENRSSSYDYNSASYSRSYHQINDPQWSEFIFFTYPGLSYDSMRFIAMDNDEVDSIDIDFMQDGTWTDIYEGVFNDRTWTEIPFAETQVEDVRIRLYASFANRGFFYQLYEFQLWRTESDEDRWFTQDACINLAPHLEDYMQDFPLDELHGSEEKTYYAIKREHGTRRISVVSCGAENNEIIKVVR